MVAIAIADPDRFVLKPQREGGGNYLLGLYNESSNNLFFNHNVLVLKPLSHLNHQISKLRVIQ